MKKATLKIAILTAAFLFFYASNGGARENFNLNSITASEFSEEFGDGGIFNFIRRENKKEWTIMIYINAKNDLEEYGMKDVNEMEMIGSCDKVNIVVELGRMDGFDSSEGDWTGSRRYLIQKDNSTSAITSPILADLGKVDMGDWKHLVDFGLWAKTKYPAKKYMLIVWNHGTGWEKSVKSIMDKGLSYDFETANHFTTPQLGAALNEIGRLDVYASDACLMQMVSIAYEIKNNITYIVGSEATELADGYTYNTMLKPIVSNPEITAYQAAKVIVDAYFNHYRSIKKGSTQSFIRTAALDKLIILMNDWAFAATQSKEKDLIKHSMFRAQRYSATDHTDLYHFLSLVTSKTLNAELKTKGEVLMNHIKESVVAYNKHTNSPGTWWSGPVDYSDSRGIAIYMPPYRYNPDYDELKIAQHSNWDEFIKWYQKKSLSTDKI